MENKKWTVIAGFTFLFLAQIAFVEAFYFLPNPDEGGNLSMITMAGRARQCGLISPFPTLPLVEESKPQTCILNMNAKNLFEISHEIKEFVKLQELYLAGNNLKDLPSEISGLPLTYIDLGDNRFRTIPNPLFSLKNLKKLEIGFNEIEAVPPEIAGLHNLKTLSLNANVLKSLPEEIGELENLQFLELSENKLSNIPASIGRLNSLKQLYLIKNRLTDLPREIEGLDNLEILDLSDNRLTNIPPVLSRLKKLVRLNLKNNPLDRNEVDELREDLPEVKIIF